MPRPHNERRLCAPLPQRVMKPAGVPRGELEEIILGFDEAEALRLADLEGLYQEAAARHMGISRPTFGRIIASARKKTADALLNGKALRIQGGEISIQTQGVQIMKIAAPSQNGQIDQHFGHCQEYLVFTTDGTTLVSQETLPSPQGCGCKSNIASVLAERGVTHLVAGNMGDGAARVLGSHGIQVIRGAMGDTQSAVQAFVNGTFKDSGLRCASHDDHDCSQHK